MLSPNDLIQLRIDIEDSSQQLETTTENVRSVLLDAGCQSVKNLTGQSPERSKSAEAAIIGSVMATLLPAILPKLLDVLHAYVQGQNSRKLHIKKGNAEITLSGSLSRREMEEALRKIKTLH